MKIRYLILGIVAIIFWGISLLATKILIQHNFTPNMITLARFSIASVLLGLSLKKHQKQKIEATDQKYFWLMAFGGIALFYYFENSGVKYTSISNTALITATIPLFTLLTAHFVYHKKMNWQNWLGLPLGLLGTVLLFINDFRTESSLHIKGDILVLASVFMWLVYSFAYRKIMVKYNTVFITYITFLYGAILLLPTLFFEYKQISLITFSFPMVVALLFLSLFCSFLAYLFWNTSIREIGVKITSNLILFLPMVSILTGILFMNESFSWSLILSTTTIILGAYLTSITAAGQEY